MTSPSRYAYRLDLVREYFPKGGRLLDVGCGDGSGARQFAEAQGMQPVGIDVVDGNAAEIDFQVYDGTTIPFEDGRFDAAIVIHVLHHTADPDRVVAEVARVCRPGARLMIIEDMASSRLQNFFTKASDLWGNRVRNFWRSITGRRKAAMMHVPMTYNIRTYPGWISTFAAHGLRLLHTQSIPHKMIEHGVFMLEKEPSAPA